MMVVANLLTLFAPADPTALLAANIAAAIAALLLASFAITGATRSAGSKAGMIRLLTESVTHSKSVVLSMLAIAVPIALLGGAATLVLLQSDAGVLGLILTPLGAAAGSLVLGLIVLAVMALSFAPQAATLENKGPIQSLAASFRFARHNAAGVYSLFAVVAGGVVLLQIALVALETIVGLAVNVDAFLPAVDFFISLAVFTFAVAAQTHYYSPGKKA
jgi:hypothetical protein